MAKAKDQTTRRNALKLVGGATLMAVAGAGSGRAALAQEASPAASPVADGGLVGKYAVVRLRTLQPDRSADALLALIRDGFVPLVAAVPGLVWYVAGANADSRDQFSVGVFADEAGAAESNQRAANWGRTGAADFVTGDPAVQEGMIGVAAAASAATSDDLIGKYVVIRLRQPNPDWPVADVFRLIGEGYVPLVRELPGFVSYFGSADPATGAQAYVGIFADEAGADESTRVAGDWLTENGYTFFEGEPTLAVGIIGAATVAAE